MPGAPTELTRRLEVSRRQFFQWHLIEQRHIPEIKKRMDELTKALTDANYQFNFVAEEKDWKSRSRAWNATRAKTAWKVEQHQKGRHLSIPAEISNLPVWVEWGQDVGAWRNNGSNKVGSQTSLVQEKEHQESYHNLSHWDGQTQSLAMTDDHDTLDASHASHASLTSPARTEISLYPFSPVKYSYTPLPPFNTGSAPWPQQNSELFTTIPFPLLPQPGQLSNTLQDYNYNPSMCYQNDVLSPLSPARGNDHVPASYMSEMELSHMRLDSWLQEGSASISQHQTIREQNSDQHDQQGYAQRSSASRLGDQHQSTGLTMGASSGLPAPPWALNEWEGSQEDSASQEDLNRV